MFIDTGGERARLRRGSSIDDLQEKLASPKSGDDGHDADKEVHSNNSAPSSPKGKTSVDWFKRFEERYLKPLFGGRARVRRRDSIEQDEERYRHTHSFYFVHVLFLVDHRMTHWRCRHCCLEILEKSNTLLLLTLSSTPAY